MFREPIFDEDDFYRRLCKAFARGNSKLFSILCLLRALIHSIQGQYLIELVSNCSGVERTIQLAQKYTKRAQETLHLLPESEAKIALEILAERVGTRTWYW